MIKSLTENSIFYLVLCWLWLYISDKRDAYID